MITLFENYPKPINTGYFMNMTDEKMVLEKLSNVIINLYDDIFNKFSVGKWNNDNCLCITFYVEGLSHFECSFISTHYKTHYISFQKSLFKFDFNNLSRNNQEIYKTFFDYLLNIIPERFKKDDLSDIISKINIEDFELYTNTKNFNL